MRQHISETRTEDTVMDLLDIHEWGTQRPPHGQVIRRNEYQGFPALASVFAKSSKTGDGPGYPDFLTVKSRTLIPRIVIEAKSDHAKIANATREACDYGDALRSAGHPVIAVGVAGQDKTRIRVEVQKYHQQEWHVVTHRGKPITWIPREFEVERLLSSDSLLDLEPVVPSADVLAERADVINRVLRESAVKDEFRPAYVGAIMLAMWYSKGKLRREPEFVLSDINNSCEAAFTRAGKPELAKSLRVDEASVKLAASAWEIIATLEKLNVATVSLAHDYLGQLYETFFRYTGGNTIGQYFTPRHITRFMADICETQPKDVVIDPACGTGGFLIACIQRALDVAGVPYDQAVKMVRYSLIGYESEPITAALCVANMILRGDGKTGIRGEDCFAADDYPANRCNVALMNPPFPHKETDTPPENFVDRALEALEQRGRLAVILPSSLLSKSSKGQWRSRLLRENTLTAVIQLPDELFQPYASFNTCVVVLEKGVPHDPRRQAVFARVHYDGLTLKKGVRRLRTDRRDDLPAVTEAVTNRREVPGVTGMSIVSGSQEWSPGAYIASTPPSEDELKVAIDELARRLFSFYVRYANEITKQRQLVEDGEIQERLYRDIAGPLRGRNADRLPAQPGTIGAEFDIFYGMKELHSRDGIPPGDSLIISPTEEYNGCYGWLNFQTLIRAPFVTVAQTGSIGEAFVQMEPCAVNDDCLILLPKQGVVVGLPRLFIAAAAIRTERWRFTYGRKLTPQRIVNFAMPEPGRLDTWVQEQLDGWEPVRREALRARG